MHVYIATEPGKPVLRRCTVLLSLTQTCFHPAHISTPKRAYGIILKCFISFGPKVTEVLYDQQFSDNGFIILKHQTVYISYILP